MTEPTTVRGHIALSGHCPHCGTLQTEHVVSNEFVRNGGVLDFRCMKCLCEFRVNWMGADDDSTGLGFITT